MASGSGDGSEDQHALWPPEAALFGALLLIAERAGPDRVFENTTLGDRVVALAPVWLALAIVITIAALMFRGRRGGLRAAGRNAVPAASLGAVIFVGLAIVYGVWPWQEDAENPLSRLAPPYVGSSTFTSELIRSTVAWTTVAGLAWVCDRTWRRILGPSSRARLATTYGCLGLAISFGALLLMAVKSAPVEQAPEIRVYWFGDTPGQVDATVHPSYNFKNRNSQGGTLTDPGSTVLLNVDSSESEPVLVALSDDEWERIESTGTAGQQEFEEWPGPRPWSEDTQRLADCLGSESRVIFVRGSAPLALSAVAKRPFSTATDEGVAVLLPTITSTACSGSIGSQPISLSLPSDFYLADTSEIVVSPQFRPVSTELDTWNSLSWTGDGVLDRVGYLAKTPQGRWSNAAVLLLAGLVAGLLFDRIMALRGQSSLSGTDISLDRADSHEGALREAVTATPKDNVVSGSVLAGTAIVVVAAWIWRRSR